MATEPRLTDEQRTAVEAFRKRHRTGVLALLFTDIVGSTRIRKQLGDAAGTQLIEHTHSLVRGLLSAFDEAEEISTAGDSFFIVFVKPSDAVRFALRLQHRLRAQDRKTGTPVELRIGVHMGEVFIREQGEGVLERDVLGVQVDTAARTMSLADGGQILLTRSVFDNARTILTGESLPGIEGLSWVNHGPYLLKGLDDPLDICEVGERDKAKLRPPTDTDAGKRATVAGAEPVLGWRPAVEQVLPGTEWELERKLGEGGFGEVWLARHHRTKDPRVFKFCFLADQLRNLKREMTLFRLLKEVLGERPDIARLYNVQFEEAPYYLELEHTPGGDLADWAESRGGIENVPLEERLEIVAQIATALAAAHSVGVIHEDVKPSNVLVEVRKDGAVQVRLTDFGIGQVTDRSVIERAGLTATGLTEMISPSAELSNRTGTRLYMAPELTAGRPPSTKSDLYSLGVLTYQLIVGDLSQPVATDWERQVDDPLLREDLHGCLAGDPANRFAGAEALAQRLRTLGERRASLAEREAAERAHARRRRIAVVSVAAAGFFLVVAALLGLFFHQERAAYRTIQKEYYHATIGLIDKAVEELRFDQAWELLSECPPEYRNWEWGRLNYLCNLDEMTLRGHTGQVWTVDFSPDGRILATGSEDGTVRLWNVRTGRTIRTIELDAGNAWGVRFSPDGRYLATANPRGRRVTLWNPHTGERLRVFTVSGRVYRAVAFSPDSDLLAIGEERDADSTHPASMLHVFDLNRNAELDTPYVSEQIENLDFSPDGRLLAFGDQNNLVQILRIGSKQVPRKLVGHTNDVLQVRFSPDGNRLLSGGMDRLVKMWNVRTGRELLSFQVDEHRVRGAVFTPDGERFVVATDGQVVGGYKTASGEELFRLAGHSRGVYELAISRDGTRIATAGGYDQTAKIWSLETARPTLVLEGHDSTVMVPVFTPDGTRLATTGYDGSVRLWNPDTGSPVGLLDADAGRCYFAAIRSDGKRLAAGYDDGIVVVWDLQSGKPVGNFKAHSEPVSGLAFSPDGKRLATACGIRFPPWTGEREIGIWNVETGQNLHTLEGHEDRVAAVTFSPDGQLLVSGSFDKTVRIWDPATGQLLRVLEPDAGFVYSVAFNPDGSRLAVGGRDGVACIYDVKSWEKRKTFSGAGGLVYSVAWSPDGKRLATGAWYRMALIWDAETGDAETGRLLLSLKGHEYAVTGVAFSPDGRCLATAGAYEGTARIWPTLPWDADDYAATGIKDFDERIGRFKQAFWQKRIAKQAREMPVARVRRQFDPSSFAPGRPVRVSLDLDWRADAPAVVVEEGIPERWQVRGVSGKGTVEGHDICWTLEPWTSPGATLEYELVPPADGPLIPVALTSGTVGLLSGHPMQIQPALLVPEGALVFQQGLSPTRAYGGCQDAQIYRPRPDNNVGGNPFLEAGSLAAGRYNHRKVLIHFDLGAVPSTFTLGRAELRLHNFDRSAAEGERDAIAPHTLYAARLGKSWAQGDKEGANGQPADRGETTFAAPLHSIIPWEIAGAMGFSDVADAESSTTVGAGLPEWISFDVTESVRCFLEHPDRNFGWKISQDARRGINDTATGYPTGVYRFKSSEAPEVGLRPMLILIPSEQAAGGNTPPSR